mgnify:CR=1 FL=1
MSQQEQAVKLVSYSQPATVFAENLMDQIAYAARVSNPANQNNTETNERLISYLIRNNHWSPFEMVSVTLEINTTRDIARQILRHRSFSFQEFSQRYAEASQMGFTIREARLQDDKNRQNSIEVDDPALHDRWKRRQAHAQRIAIENYEWAIANGIAKEVARSVLPEGMTNSRLYMAGTLRSWIHYVQLRAANGTQKEHRAIAAACAEVLYEIFPHEVFGDHIDTKI